MYCRYDYILRTLVWEAGMMRPLSKLPTNDVSKEKRAAQVVVLSLADLSLLFGFFLVYSVRDTKGKIIVIVLGLIRLIILTAMATVLQRSEWMAASWLAVAAAITWACSIAVVQVGSAARVPKWVITLACNFGPVSAVIAPAQWAYVWHNDHFSFLRAFALIVFTLLKMVGLAILRGFYLFYPDYAKAFGCYGSEATIFDYIYGYCPQYTKEPFWASNSPICRATAMDGVPHQDCNTPYKALPHAWHNWPPWVTIISYALLGVWCIQWIPAIYHGRLLTASAVAS